MFFVIIIYDLISKQINQNKHKYKNKWKRKTSKQKVSKKKKKQQQKKKKKEGKQQSITQQNLKLIIYWHASFLFNLLDITTVSILHANLTFVLSEWVIVCGYFKVVSWREHTIIYELRMISAIY